MSYDIGNTNAVAQYIKSLAANLHIDDLQDVSVRVRRYPFLVSVVWKALDKDVAGFTLVEQPNCCGALISTKTFVSEQYKGQKLAQAMMPLKEAIAREYGYSCLVATVNMTGNPAEIHILKKFGWQEGASFVNKRTKNTVGFFTKVL